MVEAELAAVCADLAVLRAEVAGLRVTQARGKAPWQRLGERLLARRPRARLGRAVLVAGLLSLALGTNALASVPDASGVIHSCLSPLTSPGTPQPPQGNYTLT